jgi:hypothetical protein
MKKKQKAKTAMTAAGKPKAPGGVKDQRSDQVRVEALRQALMAGHTYRAACTLADIGERTFFRWMAEGDGAPEGTLARQFWQLVRKASTDAIHRNLMVIQHAAKKNWTAAAWFLERRCPEDYARQIKADITTQDNTLQTDLGTLDLSKLSTDELRSLRETLAKAGQG